MRRYRISTDKVRNRLDVRSSIPCEKCKQLHFEVQEGGGWLEICEVTGGRVIGSDEGFDNCPFMEVSDDK